MDEAQQKKNRTPLAIRIPPPILERVERQVERTGISRHATILSLIATGLDVTEHNNGYGEVGWR